MNKDVITYWMSPNGKKHIAKNGTTLCGCIVKDNWWPIDYHRYISLDTWCPKCIPCSNKRNLKE